MSEATRRTRFFRLLIVDDDPSQLRALIALLRGEGLDTAGCVTASGALELVEREKFGVLVVALGLVELPWTQLVEKICRLDDEIQVVLHTGQGASESAPNMGAFERVATARGPDQLVRQVHGSLRRSLDRYAQELEEELRAELAQRTEVEADLRLARQALEATSRARSALLSKLSRQVRTPLKGVIGLVDGLLCTELSPARRDLAEMMGSSGQVLLRSLDDILDASKTEAGDLEVEAVPFDLRDTVLEASERLAPQAGDKGLDLRVDYAPDAPRGFVGDPDLIRQVILNLAGNGIEFTKQGHVAMAVECEQRDAAGARMRIAIEDTGIGIPPETLEQIFDPLRQTDVSATRRLGGAGLGLAISRRLVEKMHGDIGVQSQVDEGSTFWVSLPLRLCDASRTAPTRRAGSPSVMLPAGFDVRVLVVEDIAVNQLSVVRMLEGLGCRADVAADGREALMATAERRYDLVLMDCRMPVMDGFAAAAEIRRRETGAIRVPIVAMTADVTRGDRERCLQAGMEDTLAKPVTRSALRRTLTRWLSARRQARPGAQLQLDH